MIVSTSKGIKISGIDEYSNPDMISVEERNRIYYGELTEDDFCTCHYSGRNIDRTVNGIHNYLELKRKHIENYI